MLLGKIFDGILFIGLGAYFVLLGTGKLVVKKDSEEFRVWRSKYGAMLVVCGLIVLSHGVYRVLR